MVILVFVEYLADTFDNTKNFIESEKVFSWASQLSWDFDNKSKKNHFKTACSLARWKLIIGQYFGKKVSKKCLKPMENSTLPITIRPNRNGTEYEIVAFPSCFKDFLRSCLPGCWHNFANYAFSVRRRQKANTTKYNYKTRRILAERKHFKF